jgi:hypothetical protein
MIEWAMSHKKLPHMGQKQQKEQFLPQLMFW